MFSLVQDAFYEKYQSIQKKIVNTNTDTNQIEVEIDTSTYSGFTSEFGYT